MSMKNFLSHTRTRKLLTTFFWIFVMIFAAQLSFATNVMANASEAPLAATNTLSVNVVSALNGAPISDFQYIINIDIWGKLNFLLGHSISRI